MTMPPITPPAGTGVIPDPQIFAYPPMLPGIATPAAPSVTTPAVPATTVTATNTTGVDVAVYAATGAGVTVTAVLVNGGTLGTTMAASSGALIAYLPSTQTIALAYSGGTPTWKWQAV